MIDTAVFILASLHAEGILAIHPSAIILIGALMQKVAEFFQIRCDQGTKAFW
jgi:hypothetical protein